MPHEYKFKVTRKGSNWYTWLWRPAMPGRPDAPYWSQCGLGSPTKREATERGEQLVAEFSAATPDTP